MKLAQTILYVHDVWQAAAFYERVFGLERGGVNPEGVFIALRTGETTLAFVDAAWVAGNGIDFAPVRPNTQPPGIEISFWVEDVEATYQASRDRSGRERVVRARGEAVGPDGLVRARSERLHR
jgi:catechol 2,3-dioxygenase-like lactoylglutathione lyase family enzyme